MRTLCEGLRQEAGPHLRVTEVSPGVTDTPFIDGTGDVNEDVLAHYRSIAMPPEAVARAIAYALEQPAGVDVGSIVVRPTAQG